MRPAIALAEHVTYDTILMRRALALTCAALVGMWLGTATPVFTWPVHGSPGNPSLCPFPLTSGVDGCNNAITFGGSVSEPAYFSTYGPDPGVTYYVRPNWNVAGVDYKVGATAAAIVDPTNNANLPSHCTYNPTGSDIGGPAVVCSAGSNLDFENFHMVTSGGVCVELVVKSNWTGTVKIQNNSFDNGTSLATSCASATQLGHFVDLQSASTVTAISVLHNTFNGEAGNLGTSIKAMPAVQIDVTNSVANATLTDQYNAFLNLPDRAYDATVVNFLSEFNYTDGLNLLGCTNPPSCTVTGTHGEYALISFVPFAKGTISNGSGGSGTSLVITSTNGAPQFALKNGTAIGGNNNNGQAGGVDIASGTTVTGGSALPCVGGGCVATFTVSPSQLYPSASSNTVGVVSTTSQQYSYNVCRNAQNSTTCFYISTGGGPDQAGLFNAPQIDHNVITTNTRTGPTNSAALVELAYNNYTNGTIFDNYVDSTQAVVAGHWAAALSPGVCTNAFSFSGNIDMTVSPSGSPLTTWSTNAASGC